MRHPQLCADRRRRVSIALPALLVCLAAVLGCDASGESAPEEAEPAAAPAYSAVTLAGDSVALSDLRGEVVLLNVWATWCGPCRQEIPELQALHEEHAADGLRVVGVTVDSRSAGDGVRRFIDDFGMTYDIWWDPNQTAVSTFGAVGVPLTVLIDAEGRIVWRHSGAFQPGDPELLASIESALSSAGSRATG